MPPESPVPEGPGSGQLELGGKEMRDPPALSSQGFSLCPSAQVIGLPSASSDSECPAE